MKLIDDAVSLASSFSRVKLYSVMSLDMHTLPITVLRNAAVEPGLPYCWCGGNGVGVVRDGQTSCCKHKHSYCYELAMALVVSSSRVHTPGMFVESFDR
jgi:hypothetical protein